MSTATKGADRVGRKKRSIPARVVKLDGDLITRAKRLAEDVGMDTAQYLSEMLRPLIEREWIKFNKRILEEDKK